MNLSNLKIIEQPAWKVVIVDFVARVLGILVKVDGIPIGSNRNIVKVRGDSGSTYGQLGDGGTVF